MDENDVLFGESSEISSPSDSQSYEIDYQKIEDAFYNALSRLESEKNVSSVDGDLVEFSSATDAKCYTVVPDAEPTSSAQQQVIFLLDIRNILLIFLLIWFIFNSYHKLKTLLTNFYS